MAMVTEVSPLTEERCSRISYVLLDSFDNS